LKFLHVIWTLDPSHGGPVEGLINLAYALQEIGNIVEIATLDGDKDYFSTTQGLIIHPLGPSLGKYRFTFRLIPWLRKNVNRFDVVIIHGIWQYHSFAVWITHKLMKFPYFIFVHGALDPWFKYTYPLKHIKKWFYWPWATYNVLRSAKGVLYTTEEEKRLASHSFCLYKANEVIVNYGISRPNGDPDYQKALFFREYPALKGKHLLLFMSRIHPKKGCDILIEAFARIAEEYPLLHLVMAGPDETNWITSLQKEAKDLQIEDRITWTGMLKGDLKWGAINSAECLVLPSHSENFGVIIAESLACSIPVIITNKINIWQEIQESEAGFISPDDVSGITQSLQKWMVLDNAEKKRFGVNAKECFSKNFDINLSAKRFVEIIQNELKE